MKILGVSDTHDAGACLLVDGEIVAAASEERFTRLKCDTTYPYHAINYCLRSHGLDATELDRVALASNNLVPSQLFLKRTALFDVSDWVTEMDKFWYPKFYENKPLDANAYVNLFLDKPKFQQNENPFLSQLLELIKNGQAHRSDLCLEIRKNWIRNHLGVPDSKIMTVHHETCHAYYGYLASPIREDAIVIVAEGGGDDSNGSVFEFRSGNVERLSHSRENHIGHLFKFITLLLGMKPSQHEYKTMGLAPYANTYEKAKSYEIFKDILEVRDLNVFAKNPPKDLYFYFRDKFQGHRFDGIAGALQDFAEEIIVRWADSVISNRGIHNLIFSGGVAQNIKICKRLSELDTIHQFWVNPISGDGSLPVGAAYHAASKLYKEKISNPFDKITPLQNIYLGPKFSDKDIRKDLDKFDFDKSIAVVNDVDNDWIADQLISGKVVARFSGGMEFGQRALGNRSILADARNIFQINKINNKIKHRDFWMPFTPTILHEHCDSYLINPKKIFSPFMTVAFDAKEKAKNDLAAAIHHGDYTVRPQMLKKEMNPNYYDLIRSYESKTGVGGLLNTSLNLHGDPIVCTPFDAIDTFLKTDLDILVFDSMAIKRQ